MVGLKTRDDFASDTASASSMGRSADSYRCSRLAHQNPNLPRLTSSPFTSTLYLLQSVIPNTSG